MTTTDEEHIAQINGRTIREIEDAAQARALAEGQADRDRKRAERLARWQRWARR